MSKQFTFIFLLLTHCLFSQDTITIEGRILASNTEEPLAYVSILIEKAGTGTISNQDGVYNISSSAIGGLDTIQFQYIGFQTQRKSVKELLKEETIYLQPEVYNLAETIIFGNEIEVEKIIEKVIENKDKNYKPTNSKKTFFLRSSGTVKNKKFGMDYKKLNIEGLNEDVLDQTIANIPKETTYFSDFLGETYTYEKEEQKVFPIQKVILQEVDLTDSDELGKVFSKAFKDTAKDEYWKVKSGMFSFKIDQPYDSTETKARVTIDTFSYTENLSEIDNASISVEKKWDFLYKTNRYKYKLERGTQVNGEDVYIISFSPKGKGMYVGTLYISVENFALVRADYEYASGESGSNFQLLGVGYSELDYSASVFYEKINGFYEVKYFSSKRKSNFRFDRKVSLLKKRKSGMLFDQKLSEFKVGLEINSFTDEFIEYVVLSSQSIDKPVFDNIELPNTFEPIEVNQYDPSLWSGYSIIEPTSEMKVYRKQENSYWD